MLCTFASSSENICARWNDALNVCGIAKRLEEIWLPGDDFPVILPRTSEALYLLQRLRDEAHRFAISYQRQKRRSDIQTVLADVPGLGPSRVKELLKHFGSVSRLKGADAAAIAAVYAFIIAVFVYKDLRLDQVGRVLLDSASLSAMLLYIITNAVLFSFLMTSEGIPQAMADWMIAQGFGPIAFLLVVNVLLLLAGNVMEPSSIILILAPILFPVAMKLGIDPVHFGILIVVNMEVGMCHPPVGLNLYVASGITKMGITELTVAVAPWLLTMIGFLLLITYVPIISTWLPHCVFDSKCGLW